MWKMFDRYERGTNFLNWSLTIAEFRVFKFRREQNKKIRVLNDIVFQKLAEGNLWCEKTWETSRSHWKDVSSDSVIPGRRPAASALWRRAQTYRSIAEKYQYAEQKAYTIMSPDSYIPAWLHSSDAGTLERAIMNSKKEQIQFAHLVLLSLQGNISEEQGWVLMEILDRDPEALSLYVDLMKFIRNCLLWAMFGFLRFQNHNWRVR